MNRRWDKWFSGLWLEKVLLSSLEGFKMMFVRVARGWLGEKKARTTICCQDVLLVIMLQGKQ
jgi:hypothetical protein